MTKHTTGPWRIAEMNMQGIYMNSGAAVVCTDDGPVAEVACQSRFARGSGSSAKCNVRDANAHLIAAAPEMLEAIETAARIDKIASRAKDGRVFVDARDWEAFMAQVRAVHAKVGG